MSKVFIEAQPDGVLATTIPIVGLSDWLRTCWIAHPWVINPQLKS